MRPKIYSQSEHKIDQSLINQDALYTLSKLKNAGYRAYLVGGSVRDLLIGHRPKDFDISTSATPEQIKKLFGRKCILIGRRFRLAHIRFGRHILEVSTFRTGCAKKNELITRDNEWGTAEEDVLRRDFTINGLFYDPEDHTVIDYVNGWQDIQERTLRTIGDADLRFKQDPVRMIRLLKFIARFGFEVDTHAKKAMITCQDEISKSAPARILEEIFKMLESGASAPFFALMTGYQLMDLLFPELTHFLRGKKGEKIYRYLEEADKLNNEYLDNYQSPLNRSLLISCLLFPIVEEEIKTQYLEKGLSPHFGQIITIVNSIIYGVVTFSFTHFPRRISASAQSIMTAQYRFTPLSGRRSFPAKLMKNKEFSTTLHFLKIRSMANPKLLPLYRQLKDNYIRFKHQGEKKHHAPPTKQARH